MHPTRCTTCIEMNTCINACPGVTICEDTKELTCRVHVYYTPLRACIHCIAIDLSKLFVDCTLCRIMPCLDVIKITNGKLGANCAFLRGRG